MDKIYSKAKSVKQVYYTLPDEELAINLSKIIRDNPVCEAKIEDILRMKIMQLDAYLNLIRPINELQRDMVVTLLIEQYGNRINLIDINLFFKMIMVGSFETKILDRLDGNVIFSMLNEFLRQKDEAIIYRKEKEHHKNKNFVPDDPDPEGIKKLAEVFKSAVSKFKKHERPIKKRYTSFFDYCEKNNIDHEEFKDQFKKRCEDLYDIEVNEKRIDTSVLSYEQFENYMYYTELARLNKELENSR